MNLSQDEILKLAKEHGVKSGDSWIMFIPNDLQNFVNAIQSHSGGAALSQPNEPVAWTITGRDGVTVDEVPDYAFYSENDAIFHRDNHCFKECNVVPLYKAPPNLEEANKLLEAKAKCKCTTMCEKVLGDGCQICNPQIVIDSLKDEVTDLTADNENLEAKVKELENQVSGWKQSNKNWEKDCLKQLALKKDALAQIAELTAKCENFINLYSKSNGRVQELIKELNITDSAMNVLSSNEKAKFRAEYKKLLEGI